jgi:hypothetical protein
MNNDFGIGICVEAMAALLQLRAQLGKIVDLAVVYDPRAAVFVEYRLVSARKVDDAKAPHSESSAILHQDAFIVGPAVDDLVAHVAHQSFCNVTLPSCADHSCNSAHCLLLAFQAERKRIQTPMTMLTISGLLSEEASDYDCRAGLRPRTAIPNSPIPMSSIPIASYQRNTCS